jgi:hypothetical protein
VIVVGAAVDVDRGTDAAVGVDRGTDAAVGELT